MPHLSPLLWWGVPLIFWGCFFVWVSVIWWHYSSSVKFN